VTPAVPLTAPRRSPLRAAAVAGAGCLALAAWNPGDHGVPICPTKAMFGLDCPLCGGLRAVASLTRGHPLVAADHNVLVVALAPLAVAWWLAWWIAARRGRPVPRPAVGAGAWVAVGLVALAFTVVRNLPVAGVPHWLASGAS
jgi:hypothetical protein